MQEVKQHRRRIEEQSLKNSVLDSAAAARFSTAAALEAAREKGIAGEGCSPMTHPCLPASLKAPSLQHMAPNIPVLALKGGGLALCTFQLRRQCSSILHRCAKGCRQAVYGSVCLARR